MLKYLVYQYTRTIINNNHNYNKIPKSDWLSTVLISALIGLYGSCLSNWIVRDITRALKWSFFFFTASKKTLEFLVFWFNEKSLFWQILLKLWLIGNRTSCGRIRSVIILVIKQIGLPLRGRPILLITRMTTDRIGLHSVLLPLLIGWDFCDIRNSQGREVSVISRSRGPRLITLTETLII